MSDHTRKYYEIRIPNPSSDIQDALEACIGEVESQRYSLANDYVIIKTTNDLIQGKINAGVPMNVLFPPGLTTELTYQECYDLAASPKYTAAE